MLSTLLGLFLIFIMLVIALRWVNPPTTSFMQQQDWESLQTEKYSLRNHWVDYEELPKHSAWAVVASEDQLFWEHWGFDFESIQEAWEDRQEGVRSRGASSITQQVTKNLYLWPAESFFRKGIEAGITVLIELFWPKERILEMYLNVAEFGPGIFGIGKASEQFFGLQPSAIEPDMSARLAAVLPSPKRMRVNPPSPFTEERSKWILRQMTHLSGIAYVAVDTTDQAEPKPDFSSVAADTILTTQPVNSTSLSSDRLEFNRHFNDSSTPDTSHSDTVSDSIPSF